MYIPFTPHFKCAPHSSHSFSSRGRAKALEMQGNVRAPSNLDQLSYYDGEHRGELKKPLIGIEFPFFSLQQLSCRLASSFLIDCHKTFLHRDENIGKRGEQEGGQPTIIQKEMGSGHQRQARRHFLITCNFFLSLFFLRWLSQFASPLHYSRRESWCSSSSFCFLHVSFLLSKLMRYLEDLITTFARSSSTTTLTANTSPLFYIYCNQQKKYKAQTMTRPRDQIQDRSYANEFSRKTEMFSAIF